MEKLQFPTILGTAVVVVIGLYVINKFIQVIF